MKVTPLKIDGAWIIELNKFEEGRGIFYKSSPKKVIKKYFGRQSEVKESNTTLRSNNSVIGFGYSLIHPSPDLLNTWYPEIRLSR
jgi:hypothetical protein